MGNLPCRSDKPCLDPESGLPTAKDLGSISLPARRPGMPGRVDSHLCAAAQASSRAFTWRGPSRSTRCARPFLRLLRRGARRGEGEFDFMSRQLSVMRLRLCLHCTDACFLLHWRALHRPKKSMISLLSMHGCRSGALRAWPISHPLCAVCRLLGRNFLGKHNLEGMQASRGQQCR